MMNFPTEIKTIIEQLMTSPKFKERWTEHIIQSKWKDWVGKQIAQHIRPSKFKNGQLTVIIDDDRWTNPFDAFKDKILEKTKKDLEPSSIEGFTMMVEKKRSGQKKPKKKTKEKIKKSDSLNIQSPKPCQSLEKEMEMELKCIKDPAIRDALRRLIMKSLSCNQL